MLDLYVFYVIAALTVISSLAIFIQKKLVYAVGLLTAVFIGSAAIFLLLSQTLIALLQLIVFVGGLSTYLIVAVATEQKNTKLLNPYIFLIGAIVLFIGLASVLNYLPNSTAGSTPSFLNSAASAFQSDYLILYLVVALLFGITLGGTLIIKKFAKLIV